MSFQRVDRHAFEAEKAKLNLVNADMEMNRLQNSQRHAPAIEYNKKMNEKPRTSEKDPSKISDVGYWKGFVTSNDNPLHFFEPPEEKAQAVSPRGFGRKTFAPDAAPQLQDHLTSSNVGMVDGPVDGRPAGKKKFPDPILASYAREDEKERAEAEKAAATAQRNAAKHESAKAAADLERDLLAKYPHGVPRHVLHALKAQGAVPGSANLPNLGHGQFF